MSGSGRAGVTVVCVFNDEAVLDSCLRRSVEKGLPDAPATELVAIDNRDGRFGTAGAALNHGAAQARNEVVAFVHQDVYLHSLPALERAAAAMLADDDLGILGAVGIAPTGDVLGVVRDRVVMIGTPAGPDSRVDSLDEVLFMLRRDQVAAEPLSEDPRLAWHAYAVEYCARVQSAGRRASAMDLVLTHNSMTLNLARLAEAHAHVAALHPSQTPLRTTCGIVRGPDGQGRLRRLARRRHGLARWWRESVTAGLLAHRSHLPAGHLVLGDVRLEIDDILEAIGADELDVLNVAPDADPVWDVAALRRRDARVTYRSVAATSALQDLDVSRTGRALLATGLDADTVAEVARRVAPASLLVGHTRDVGTWALVHPGAGDQGSRWSARRDRPFGRRSAPPGREERSTMDDLAAG